jgi:hypothetical protein
MIASRGKIMAQTQLYPAQVEDVFSTRILTSKELLKTLCAILHLSNREKQFGELYFCITLSHDRAAYIEIKQPTKPIQFSPREASPKRLEKSIQKIIDIFNPRYLYCLLSNQKASPDFEQCLLTSTCPKCDIFITNDYINYEFPIVRERLALSQYLTLLLSNLDLTNTECGQYLYSIFSLPKI